jgi:hypothetical protein
MTRSIPCLTPLGLVVVLSACGDRPDLESACSAGNDLLSEFHAELARESPNCESDADCTTVGYGVECQGSRISLCGTVIHRGSLGSFEKGQAHLTEEFCSLVHRSKYGCSVQASCVALQPVCQASRCAAALTGLAPVSGTVVSP